MRQELGLDVDAKASFAVLWIDATSVRKRDSEDFGIFEATASTPFNLFEIEFAGYLLKLWFCTAFYADFIVVCKYVGYESCNVCKLIVRRLEISVVKDIDTVFSEAFADMRIVVQYGNTDSGDSHISVEKLCKHVFHVSESFVVWNDRITSQYNVICREALIDEMLKGIDGLSVGKHIGFVNGSAVSGDSRVQYELFFVAEHGFLELSSSKVFCEDDGSVDCGKLVFPGKVDSCVSSFGDSDFWSCHCVFLPFYFGRFFSRFVFCSLMFRFLFDVSCVFVIYCF